MQNFFHILNHFQSTSQAFFYSIESNLGPKYTKIAKITLYAHIAPSTVETLQKCPIHTQTRKKSRFVQEKTFQLYQKNFGAPKSVWNSHNVILGFKDFSSYIGGFGGGLGYFQAHPGSSVVENYRYPAKDSAQKWMKMI